MSANVFGKFPCLPVDICDVIHQTYEFVGWKLKDFVWTKPRWEWMESKSFAIDKFVYTAQISH